MTGILWAVAAWGPRSIDHLIRHHIPAMLLPGNADALQEHGPLRCALYTAIPDIDAILPAANLIRARIGDDNVEIVAFPPVAIPPHQALAAIQRLAVDRAIALGAGLTFTYSDVVMPEGQYAGLGTPANVKAHDIGCFLQSGGLHVKADHPLWKHGFVTVNRIEAIFASATMADGMEHPLAALCTVGDNGPRAAWPCRLRWTSGAHSVFHSFHLEPILCWPTAYTDGWRQCLDIDFAENATFARPGIELAETFTLAELCPPGLAAGHSEANWPLSPRQIAEWAVKNTTRMGIEMFRRQGRFGGAPKNDWAQLQATAIADMALAILDGR